MTRAEFGPARLLPDGTVEALHLPTETFCLFDRDGTPSPWSPDWRIPPAVGRELVAEALIKAKKDASQ